MDYLQYRNNKFWQVDRFFSFKPYYKWITFNILYLSAAKQSRTSVLNLIINGLPSICRYDTINIGVDLGFKPYYKWITFNILLLLHLQQLLMLRFKPYYKWITFNI